jgi:predicted transcriptional regulator
MEKRFSLFGKRLDLYKETLTEEQAKADEKVSRMMQHHYRRRILEFLTRYPDELYVVELSEVLHIPYASLVYQLHVLKKADMLDVYYYKTCAYYVPKNAQITHQVQEIQFTKDNGKISTKKLFVIPEEKPTIVQPSLLDETISTELEELNSL